MIVQLTSKSFSPWGSDSILEPLLKSWLALWDALSPRSWFPPKSPLLPLRFWFPPRDGRCPHSSLFSPSVSHGYKPIFIAPLAQRILWTQVRNPPRARHHPKSNLRVLPWTCAPRGTEEIFSLKGRYPGHSPSRCFWDSGFVCLNSKLLLVIELWNSWFLLKRNRSSFPQAVS